MSDPLTIGIGVGVVGALLVGLSQQQKTTIEVGKLSNRTFQGSEYGGDIPRVYGTVGLSGSQIVWMEKNQLKEVVKKKKSGGKGGASTATKTYSYFATFALMLCQGEIAGIRRIWCSDKLIYNAGSDDLETIIASNQAAKGWRLYRGTDDQLPDPRYEADVGVGNAPAFRGYSYIVFDDFALADYGNTLQAAQFKVEVIAEVNGLGLREYLETAQGRIALNDTATVVSAGGGVVTFAANPSDPRPDLGDVGGYFGFKYRLADGQFVSAQSVAGKYVNPALSSFNYPIGHDGKWAWSYHYNNAYTYVSVYGAHTNGLQTALLTPYAGESYIGFGAYVVDDLLYVFRRRADLSSYYEIYSDGVLTSTHEVQLSPGVPYTRWIGNYIYHPDKGATPIVEAGGEVMWLIDSGDGATIGPSVRTFLRDSSGNFVQDEVLSHSFSTNQIWGAASDGVLTLVFGSSIISFIRSVKFDYGYQNLGDVIASEVAFSELIQPSDIDVSLLTQDVRGYRVPGGTIRSVIEPLQGAYPFDVVPSGYKIKFVPRGQSSVMTIPWEDLAANDGDDIGDSLPYSREMDSQLPQKVTVTALSSTREYASATQSYERLNTSAVNAEERDIPLVLSDDEIAQMSEKLLFLRWLERDDFDGPVLPPTYLALEVADAVAVQAKFGTFELRLTEINYESDGRLTCKSKLNNAAIYSSNAAGAPDPGPNGNVPLRGQSLALELDIPVVDETVQNTPGFVGVMSGYTDGWPGGVMIRSVDNGQTWTDLQGFTGKATIGFARGTLPVSACTLIDQRALVVDMLSGELESITRDQMLLGANYAAYGAYGRWEIIRFQNAVLQADGSYRLSGFVRGDRGTEWTTGLHQSGDYLVLLADPDNIFIDMAIGSIGAPSLYRGVTQGASIDSADDTAFTYQGVNLECLSPVYAKGARDGSSNFNGSFTRRSRLSSTWWTNGVVAPIGETSEAYEIDVMSGATVKRTISVTSPAWTYSAADQATDFGSAQSSITFRIYQLSGTVGRGYVLEATL